MQSKQTITVVQTAKDTQDRLTRKPDINFSNEYDKNLQTITIDTTQEYQTLEGFGGAFTESSAYVIQKMSKDKQEEILKAYFDPKEGLGYSLGRTHMNSCDFSLDNYACADVPDDMELKNFNIERDRKYIIPFIKNAIKIRGSSFKMLVSPWSPPAWMKTNGEMNNGGKLKDNCQPAWALHYSKFIKSYEAEGIPVWAVSVQNEPAAVQKWDSCIFDEKEESDFVKNHLGPQLHKDGLKDVKIVIWDHNKDIMFKRADVPLSDPEAAKYIWGVGFHWYGGDHFETLDRIHNKYPDKALLFTEGCMESGVKLGSWDSAECYGHEIIGDLNNWTMGYLDWNIVLDEIGGPNHVGNYCDAPIIADTATNTVIYQSAFYYIGQFSKFIKPGSVRVGCKNTVDGLEVTSFKNEDGKITVVVMNRTDNEIKFNLKNEDRYAACLSLPHSMVTYIFK